MTAFGLLAMLLAIATLLLPSASGAGGQNPPWSGTGVGYAGIRSPEPVLFQRDPYTFGVWKPAKFPETRPYLDSCARVEFLDKHGTQRWLYLAGGRSNKPWDASARAAVLGFYAGPDSHWYRKYMVVSPFDEARAVLEEELMGPYAKAKAESYEQVWNALHRIGIEPVDLGAELRRRIPVEADISKQLEEIHQDYLGFLDYATKLEEFLKVSRSKKYSPDFVQEVRKQVSEARTRISQVYKEKYSRVANVYKKNLRGYDWPAGKVRDPEPIEPQDPTTVGESSSAPHSSNGMASESNPADIDSSALPSGEFFDRASEASLDSDQMAPPLLEDSGPSSSGSTMFSSLAKVFRGFGKFGRR